MKPSKERANRGSPRAIRADGVASGTTKHHGAEEALRESQALMNAIVNSTPDMIWSVDPASFRLLNFNNSFRDYFFQQRGIRVQIGMRAEDILPTQDFIDQWNGFFQRALLEGSYVTDYVVSAGSNILQLTFNLLKRDGNVFGISVFGEDITERKHAEEELRRSQEELQSVLASIADYLWSADIDSQGRVTYRDYSPVVERITGRPPEFYMSGPDRWLSTIHPGDRPRLQAAVESVSTSQLPFMTEEYRIILPDETIRWVRDSVQVQWEEGRGRIDGVVSDITERKQAEQALRQSEATRREALLAAQMGVWEWTLASDSLTWDENLDRIAGRDPKLLVPSDQKAPQIFTPESLERLKAAVESTLLAGNPFELDLELVRPDGSKRWLIGRGEPLRNASGLITHLRGTVQDITERKQAEEALRQSEARFRTLIDKGPVAVGIGRNGVTIYVNQLYLEMFGIEKVDELVGRPIGEQWSPTSRAMIEELARQRSLGLPVPERYEVIGLRKDGSEFPVQVAVTMVDLPDGRATLAFLTDITERKTLEVRLQQAAKMEAVGRLAGGVAHDFNNLLTIINGYGELVLDRLNTDDPMRGHINEIMKAGDRAASLTRQLLAFSRQQVLAPQVLDLNTLVADVEKMLGRLIGEDIDLSVVRDSALGQVKADPGQIEQILMNLAVNARDAMPQGGKLVIETANVELDDSYADRHTVVAPGRYVMLAVTDTGIGMSAETQSHIFEPFFTTKEKG
jgi:PAS domain S-box-containing protein